jgi:hypothetical protein
VLATLAERREPWEPVDFPWQLEIPELDDRQRTLLTYARRFSESIHGAALVYNPNGAFRQRILDYLTQGDIAPVLERLVDEPRVRLKDWMAQLQVVAAGEDALELRGNAARLLASYPDHPGLLVARGYSETLIADGRAAEYASSIESALRNMDRYAIDDRDRDDLVKWLIREARVRPPAAAPSPRHTPRSAGRMTARACGGSPTKTPTRSRVSRHCDSRIDWMRSARGSAISAGRSTSYSPMTNSRSRHDATERRFAQSHRRSGALHRFRLGLG